MFANEAVEVVLGGGVECWSSGVLEWWGRRSCRLEDVGEDLGGDGVGGKAVGEDTAPGKAPAVAVGLVIGHILIAEY